jgi:hypothetical protein
VPLYELPNLISGSDSANASRLSDRLKPQGLRKIYGLVVKVDKRHVPVVKHLQLLPAFFEVFQLHTSLFDSGVFA